VVNGNRSHEINTKELVAYLGGDLLHSVKNFSISPSRKLPKLSLNDYGPSGIPGRINEFYTPAESNHPPE
jgi:hypothetical protein